MPQRKKPVSNCNRRPFWSRMLRAARLDGATFIDLKEDSTATLQAVCILILASLSYGVGFALLPSGIESFQSPARLGLFIVFWTLWFLLTLTLLSVTTFFVGTRLLRGNTSFQGLIRPAFFATSPGLLFILVSVPGPGIGDAIAAALWGWVLIAGVFAVRHAMGFSIQQSMLAFIIFSVLWFGIGTGLVFSLLPV